DRLTRIGGPPALELGLWLESAKVPFPVLVMTPSSARRRTDMNHAVRTVFIVLGCAFLSIRLTHAQAPAQKPKFEVASIKPSDPGQRGSSIMNQPGGRLVVSRVPLRMLMTFAYRVRDFQILGGPGWIGTDMWDMEARAEAGAVA